MNTENMEKNKVLSLWKKARAYGMPRRQFLLLLVSSGAAAVLIACSPVTTTTPTPTPTPTATTPAPPVPTATVAPTVTTPVPTTPAPTITTPVPITPTSTPTATATPTVTTPTFTAPDIDAAALFVQNCSPCHGANREGVVGPSLKAADIQARGRTDDYLRQTITNGLRGMPAWVGKLAGAQIDALIKFLRS